MSVNTEYPLLQFLLPKNIFSYLQRYGKEVEVLLWRGVLPSRDTGSSCVPLPSPSSHGRDGKSKYLTVHHSYTLTCTVHPHPYPLILHRNVTPHHTHLYTCTLIPQPNTLNLIPYYHILTFALTSSPIHPHLYNLSTSPFYCQPTPSLLHPYHYTLSF